ncbi:MAG TPA: chemotaxis protein CheB [Bacteroidales bacterium]|jgi:two-component system chemotaxis response regulator CheB|nr:chemotaxis protein CheB [Bacteroidales bacterium]
MSYNAVVIGASAGGFYAFRKLIPKMPKDFSMPILIVQHTSPTSDNYLAQFLNKLSKLNVKEVDEKEEIKSGYVYIAPPNYHLLIEEDHTLSLSTEEKKNYSRPSIDILFETAAIAYGKSLIGIILTGANDDGAEGLLAIQKAGGFCIVQKPDDAEVDTMPIAAIEQAKPNKILKLDEIAKFLTKLDNPVKQKTQTKNK